jgi:geranylgeranyl reductase family protein
LSARAYDALVVGSGPAGSIAALVLARAGARVALVDKATFPRDKACGDLVGPRGVRLLEELHIDIPAGRRLDDMIVVGPTGRQVSLPCYDGQTYPGFAIAVPRRTFDAALQGAAVSAGAEPMTARAEVPRYGADGEVEGFTLSDGRCVHADVVVGADGATSRVAHRAGLLGSGCALWGFAMRAYVEDPVEVPHIVFWEQTPRRTFPGYGWLFPGTDGRANLGLGLGMLSDRRAAPRAAHAFQAFSESLRSGAVLTGPQISTPPRLGGWLKMGMVGTTPARGRVLLVGDAAGLVNPLQGEGISQAMGSGRAAAEAILAGPGEAAVRYRRSLAATYAPYQSLAAPIHRSLLPRPAAMALVSRILTAPGVGRTVAGGWSLFWNDLLAGAQPRPSRQLAATAFALARLATSRGSTKRWFDENLPAHDPTEVDSSTPASMS